MADSTDAPAGLIGPLLTGSFSAIDRPDPALDPYLDGFAAAVMRFGVTRTRMQDVAAEVGVDRTTVFRKAGSLDRLIQSYLAREVHRFFDALLTDVPVDLDGPDLVVEMVASAIERAQAHPVLAKALADEPDLVARLALLNLSALVGHVREVVATGLSLLSGIGLTSEVDGEVVADWIARFGITAVADPPHDARASLRTMLVPLLTA